MNDELIGTRLGNYDIQSALGQGGMARVYRAWDVTLKRAVAVKVVEPTLGFQERYRERFEREAQAVAALDHPNIVPVYYFGEMQNVYFLVMKFIEGEDLGVLMNRYAMAGEYLSTNDILRIVDGVVSALDYAHGRGVIHRDVKPSNIMIDTTGHPYLTDFGLALNLSQGTVGDVLGTPHYVAPEQARSSADAGPQSDLYSLGIMLYEIFTGVVPFDDPSPTAVALQHVMNDPVAPRTLNREISPQLEDVILTAMAKQPQERYQTGKEMAIALRAALQYTASSHEAAEFPALPPLPPGFQIPPQRRLSTRSVAAEVRASLAQRPPADAFPTPKPATMPANQPPSLIQQTVEHQSPDTLAAVRSTGQTGRYLPLAILGGVIVAVLLIVSVVAILLNNSSPMVAGLPTLESTINQSNINPTVLPTATLTTLPAAMATEIVPISTSVAAAATLEIPTNTLIPPTATSIPPTPALIQPTSIPVQATATPDLLAAAPSLPTVAPVDWLPVRFIYTADAFYWMNDSDRVISSKSIVFERVGGTEHFEGNRMAYYSMEPGRCMQLMFADVAQQGCPEGRRPNSFFTPTRTQGVDFWTGNTGQFRVLWNGIEVAICEIAAGQCSAFVPPE
jgi:serine/threonine protein kinase